MKADLIILDGRHLLYRTSDAFRTLSAEIAGEEMATGGMYGFLSIALKIHARYKGKTVVAWEGIGRNFRLGLYPRYKRKDEAMDPVKEEFIGEMHAQEQMLREMLKYAGVRQYLGKECEADDVIGHLARIVGGTKGKRVIIYSGDSDLRSLVIDDHVWTVSPGGRKGDKLYDEAEVENKHGVPPRLLSELKALAGDNSDNIPGIGGIGPKTAAALLMHYDSLKATIRAALNDDDEWPVADRFKPKIAEGVKQLKLYLKLTTIDTECGMALIEPERSQRKLIEMLHAFKFRTLASPAELHGLMSLGK